MSARGSAHSPLAAHAVQRESSALPPSPAFPLFLEVQDDGRGSTALHVAAGFGRVAIASALLDAGADVTAADSGGIPHPLVQLSPFRVSPRCIMRAPSVTWTSHLC